RVLFRSSEEKGFFKDEAPVPETDLFLQNDYILGELPRRWEYPDFEMRQTMVQEYYLVNFDSSAFLGLNSPVAVTPYISWDDTSFSRIYSVESTVSTAWGWDLADSPAPSAHTPEEQSFLEYYTQGGDREDLKELAAEITRGAVSYYDKVESISYYLQDNYFYSLNPGEAESGDQLSHFLFESGKGYCSYFAFAMALLCRSSGIPARVALGFWIDESSQVLNYYPVRANQAHAWVEVYFPRFGWIEFDPTSQTMAPGEEFTFSPFSPREMEAYLKEIMENRDSLLIPEAREASHTEKVSSWRRIVSTAQGRAAGILFIVSALFVCYRLIQIYTALFRVKGKESSGRFFHLHMYILFFRYGESLPSESCREYALRMEQEIPRALDLVALYEKIRFGRSSLADLKRLEEEGRLLRRAVAASVTKRKTLFFSRLLIRLLFRRGRRR
ncbi:MAG: transglutaminase-like domain-containing protein, partial [Spirochaetales bacterium]|nr:transglutaminase-like domain-containing protein [Spirochaetales bacterium]